MVRSKRSCAPAKAAMRIFSDPAERKRFSVVCERMGLAPHGNDVQQLAHLGLLWLYRQQDFIAPLRRPGAPAKRKGSKIDETILDRTEQLMRQKKWEFDVALSRAISDFEEKLAPADRTTHPKRLRRLAKARRQRGIDRIAQALTVRDANSVMTFLSGSLK